jgi:hypothetical protein
MLRFSSHKLLIICSPQLGIGGLTPVILATQKAEIRRISIQSQPRQIVLQDPTLKKSFTKKGWWSGSR